jgi:hypothetical protein
MLNEYFHKEYMKLAVVGSRTFNDYTHLKMSLDVFNTLYHIALIVSGERVVQIVWQSVMLKKKAFQR